MADLLFVVNDLQTLSPDQTTAGLVHAAAAQGHAVWVCEAAGAGLGAAGVEFAARAAPAAGSVAEVVEGVRRAPRRHLPAAELSGVWVRTNPGRATGGAGSSLLQLLHQVHDAGVPVRNAPGGLERAASKLFLGSLPAEVVPTTYAADDVARLREHLEALGGSGVVKPALGTRGAGTARVELGQPDLDAVLNEALAQGPALIQAYLPAAPQGDVRVHVVDGQLFELDGASGVVRRVPGPGEWRSNVALGGTPEATEATPRHRAVVTAVGPLLRQHGLWHVGLDVVGDHIVECNVFSPGGLGDLEMFTGRPFTAALVERFVASLAL